MKMPETLALVRCLEYLRLQRLSRCLMRLEQEQQKNVFRFAA
jgi:hypothetical protein